jgi:hypothetical protein
MLSETELENIFSWRPYRPEWPVNRTSLEHSILEHFGALIKDMVNNPVFNCTQTQTGEITNYLEFLCYPSAGKSRNLDRTGLLVCVSLCAPVVAYGETIYKMDSRSFAYAFPDASQLGAVETKNLLPVETELHKIFEKHQLKIVPANYAAEPLPDDMVARLDSLNFGNTRLHALFQWKSAE